jgi:mono/diheme cytochrome c family protein
MTMRRTALSIALAIVLVFAFVAPTMADSEGKALYVAKCAMCHGQDGVPKKMGEGSKAFGSPEFKTSATAGSIVSDIRDGKGKMKPIKNVTEAQAGLIATYILTMGAEK